MSFFARRAASVLLTGLLGLIILTGAGADALLKAGTYTAAANGKDGPVKVEVTIAGGKIASVKVIDQHETVGISDVALERIPQQIVAGQSLAVDAVTGASMTSNAIVEAVTDCVRQAGGDPSAWQTKAAENSATVEMAADVVVVGAGASGSAAAMAAREAGAKVILLEKAAIHGGAGAMGGGLFGANSQQQKALKVSVDNDKLFAAWMQEMTWKADANLVRTFIDNSGATVDWLLERGFKLHFVPNVQKTHVDFAGYHHYQGDVPTVEYFKAFLAGFVKKGGQVLYETPAQKLLTDGSGSVVGVQAKKADGTIVKISAKKVIIATGGFGGDGEWVSQSLGGVSVNFMGAGQNKGDGIRMAWSVGAAHRGENVSLLHITTVPGDFSKFQGFEPVIGQFSLAYLPMSIWVNRQGVRFANEDIAYDRALNTNAAVAQGSSFWAILSQEMVDKLEKSGAGAIGMYDDIEMGPIPTLTPRTAPWTHLNAILAEGIRQKVMAQGDTPAQLAAATGMDPTVLQATLATYNAAVKAGKDSRFLKEKAHLYPLNGKLYAVKVVSNNLATLGGIRIDDQFRVVKVGTLAPIPNLYAVGADASGLYSDHYILLDGGSMGWAYTSGRLAGTLAAQAAK